MCKKIGILDDDVDTDDAFTTQTHTHEKRELYTLKLNNANGETKSNRVIFQR